MLLRWIGYLAAWCICLLIHVLNQGWLSWVLLVALSVLPLLSLLLSMPAMLTARLEFSLPPDCIQGTVLYLKHRVVCSLPISRWQLRLQLEQVLQGAVRAVKPGEPLIADHCGLLRIHVQKACVYDHLGLFRLPLRGQRQLQVLVRPLPQPPESLPEIDKNSCISWRSKPGGGMAENHELRLYRPGDALRQIHWKLSAKTGKLILRDAMVPQQRRLQLLLLLRGSPQELDCKLGRLLWLGTYLLEKKLHFEVWSLTGLGLICHRVQDSEQLQKCLDALLSSPPAGPAEVLPDVGAAHWQYVIGGDSDEES